MRELEAMAALATSMSSCCVKSAIVATAAQCVERSATNNGSIGVKGLRSGMWQMSCCHSEQLRATFRANGAMTTTNRRAVVVSCSATATGTCAFEFGHFRRNCGGDDCLVPKF